MVARLSESMFTITARIRQSKAKNAKPGYGQAVYMITSARVERSIPAGFSTGKDGLTDAFKDKIIEGLRLIYCIIERRYNAGGEFSIDDIVADYRTAVDGDPAFGEVISRSKRDVAVCEEIASIGRDFKNEFLTADTYGGHQSALLGGYISSLIRQCKGDGRIGRARSLRSLQRSLSETMGVVSADMIDGRFISKYQSALLLRDISADTVSFYMRTLRAVLNHASKDGLLSVDRHWFDSVDTRIDRSGGKTLAKALDKDMLRKISETDLSDDRNLELARDVFMFCFYMRGMELVDAAHLRRDNIRDGFVTYKRRLKGALVHVPVEPQALALIEKYHSDERELIFPILSSTRSESFEAARNAVNLRLKEIGRRVGCRNLKMSMSRGSWLKLMATSSLTGAIL